MNRLAKRKELFQTLKRLRRNTAEKKNPHAMETFSLCPICHKALSHDVWEREHEVCPSCGAHRYLSPEARCKLLFDHFDIIECKHRFADPLHFPEYSEKQKALLDQGIEEAVMVVRGRIGDVLCYAYFMNARYLMGSLGMVVGERIADCFLKATDEGLPVLGFTASGGARMQEGIYALAQMAHTTMAVQRHHKEGLLYIAMQTDPTTGGVSASFANLADIILAEPGARLCFTGKRVIEQTLREQLPEGFQTAEHVLKHGFLDAIVPRGEQKEYLGRLLMYHQR